MNHNMEVVSLIGYKCETVNSSQTEDESVDQMNKCMDCPAFKKIDGIFCCTKDNTNSENGGISDGSIIHITQDSQS